jgi:hypothetical protein
MSTDYVRHGTLAVQRAIERQYEEAKRYLSRDPVEKRLFQRLEHETDGRTFVLRGNPRNDDSFDPNTNTIAWDPYSALRTTAGGRQSPALGLGHEVDHAVENPRVADRLRKCYERGFDDAEERRVILGSETDAARALGEDARTDHRGRAFRVASPLARGAAFPSTGAYIASVRSRAAW